MKIEELMNRFAQNYINRQNSFIRRSMLIVRLWRIRCSFVSFSINLAASVAGGPPVAEHLKPFMTGPRSGHVSIGLSLEGKGRSSDQTLLIIAAT
ncbi:MAG: hypothetical protein KJP06_09140 [Deltaproteobacteria bacterium]|nr:hypothetical protein [Deltaproteobacteria bacterium]